MRILVLLLAAGCFFTSCRHATNDLPNYVGPLDATMPLMPAYTSPGFYHTINDGNKIALFLTDSTANWLGLVHSFKTFGIPFTICKSLSEALANKVVFIYPGVSNIAFSPAQMRQLASYIEKGGTLITCDVTGALSQ